ncbi:MAG: glycosyl hydrolase family 18 protein [Bacillota bacterium]|nr:glycosyl hydrolase family 18 protein [Bacillota bacterium]
MSLPSASLPAPAPRPRPLGRLLPFGLLAALLLAVAAWLLWPLPDLPWAPAGGALLVDGAQLASQRPWVVGSGPDAGVYLPLSWVRSRLDPHLVWDSASGQVIVTRSDAVYRLPLRFPVVMHDGQPWMELALLRRLYGAPLAWVPASRTVVADPAGAAYAAGQVRGSGAVPLRARPAWRSGAYGRLAPATPVLVLRQSLIWLEVRDPEGRLGWLPLWRVRLGGGQVARAGQPAGVALAAAGGADAGPAAPPLPAWAPHPPGTATGAAAGPVIPPGQRLNLTFALVTQKDLPVAAGAAPPGVNVVAPTWFELSNGSGDVTNLASVGAVAAAHQHGLQVWAVATNGFDPARTHALLQSAAARQRFVTQLLAFAALYGIDGINLDFENVQPGDGALYTQLVRELVPPAHAQRLTVSVDVAVVGGSPSWSGFFQHAELATTADFLVLMAYDQYWSGSPVAGPVAAVDWTGAQLRQALQRIPAERLLLGVPFYTRVWRETPSPGGGAPKLTSTAVSTAQGWKLAAQHGVNPVYDPVTGEYVARYKQGSSQVSIWLDGPRTWQARVDLVRRYRLAGIASWQLGFASSDLWTALAGIQQPPY